MISARAAHFARPGSARDRRRESAPPTAPPCLVPQAALGHKYRMPTSCHSHPKLRSRLASSRARSATASPSRCHREQSTEAAHRFHPLRALVSYLDELTLLFSSFQCPWFAISWSIDRIPTTTQTLLEAGVFGFPRRAKPSTAA